MSEKKVRWVQRLANYKAALARLAQLVELSTSRELSDIEKTAFIKMFEYTYELSWNLLKDFFESLGDIEIAGPRDVFELAFKRKLIKQAEADLLVKSIKSRNLTSHTYNEETAEKVVDDVINMYYSAYVELAKKMDAEKKERGL